jgi:hypothetical protein
MGEFQWGGEDNWWAGDLAGGGGGGTLEVGSERPVRRLSNSLARRGPGCGSTAIMPAIHYSLFTIHYSLFTIHYSLFAIRHSPFAIRRGSIAISVRGGIRGS